MKKIAVAMSLVWLAVLCAGCRVDSFRFYDVIRRATEESDILPQGEFPVEQESLSPPISEVWAVERSGDQVRVYVDEEVWVGAPPAPDDDPALIIASTLEVATRDPGPCTTTTERALRVAATEEDLVGEIREKTRLVGPEDCGETPRGRRTVSRVDGTLGSAP